MEKTKGGKTGLMILAALVAVGLLIFGMSMMLERDRSEGALAATQKKLEAANVQSAALTTEVNEWSQRALTAEETLDTVQAELENVKGENARLTQQVAALEAEQESMAGRLDETSQSLDTLKTENAALWEAYTAADSAKAEAVTDGTQTKAALTDAQKELDAAQKKIEGLTVQLETSQAEGAALEEKLVETQQTLSSVQAERTAASAQRDEALQSLAAAQASLAQAEEGRAAAENALARKEAEYSALQLEHQETSARLTEAENTILGMQEEARRAQAELEEANALYAQTQMQLEDALENLTAARNELAVARETAELSADDGIVVPLGTWVMEPYTFEVPDHVMMQQDTEGGWHFYYDEAGSVLSCARVTNPAYLDEGAVLQMYTDTVNQLAEALGVDGSQAVYTPVTINGRQALLAEYTMGDMTLTVLQYCHDGVNTLIASFTDVSEGRTLARPVMEKMMDSLVYLPDEM